MIKTGCRSRTTGLLRSNAEGSRYGSVIEKNGSGMESLLFLGCARCVI